MAVGIGRAEESRKPTVDGARADDRQSQLNYSFPFFLSTGGEIQHRVKHIAPSTQAFLACLKEQSALSSSCEVHTTGGQEGSLTVLAEVLVWASIRGTSTTVVETATLRLRRRQLPASAIPWAGCKCEVKQVGAG